MLTKEQQGGGGGSQQDPNWKMEEMIVYAHFIDHVS